MIFFDFFVVIGAVVYVASQIHKEAPGVLVRSVCFAALFLFVWVIAISVGGEVLKCEIAGYVAILATVCVPVVCGIVYILISDFMNKE